MELQVHEEERRYGRDEGEELGTITGRGKHQFFKVLIGTYLSRSCATPQTMQLERCWDSG